MGELTKYRPPIRFFIQSSSHQITRTIPMLKKALTLAGMSITIKSTVVHSVQV